MVPFENADVAASFDAFPTPIRGYLLALGGDVTVDPLGEERDKYDL